jgi:hypothetical protein
MVGSWAIQLNSYKNFKIPLLKLGSKRRIEFVKDDVIFHIFTRTSQHDKWSKIFGKTQILLEKLIQERHWIVNHFVIKFCHFAFCFGITPYHLMKHVSFLFLYCFEVRRCLTFYLDKIKPNQSLKIKSVLIAKMTCWHDKIYRVTKQILKSYIF